MKELSTVCRLVSSEISIIRDCTFDSLYLIGKPKTDNKKVISFITDKRYIDIFLEYDIQGAICTREVARELVDIYEGGIAITEEPKTAFFEIHNYYALQGRDNNKSTISPTAKVHPMAQIAENNVVIGDNTTIMAGVVVKEGTIIGDNCTIREACIIGTPAFYYYGSEDKRKLVESTGGIIIGNNVELHTHCVVEKGVMGADTVIGNNTKIDNAVVVGHDTIIGDNCTIAGNALFAGGVHLGNGVFIGVSATVVPNIVIEDDVTVSSGAIVTKRVEKGSHVSGNFAINHDKFLEHIKSIR